MTDAEKLRLAVAEDTFVGNLIDLGRILVAEIKRLQAELDRVKGNALNHWVERWMQQGPRVMGAEEREYAEHIGRRIKGAIEADSSST
jgi:hypothetical protein